MHMFSMILAGALLVLVATNARAEEASDLFARAEARLAAREAALVELRHDLHRHPELSGQEERTAGVVATWLGELGFEVREGVGGHGVVATLSGSRPGPVIAFRADMDAVRSHDPDPVEYRSLEPGIRHICGHDVHTTIGVALAEAFAATRDALPGSVMLVFQPAEETGTGAKAMLADGAFEPTPPDAIFAVHTAPYPVGDVATRPDAMMSGRASFSVSIRGDGDVQAAKRKLRELITGIGNFTPLHPGQAAPEGFIMVRLNERGSTLSGQVMTAGFDDRARAEASFQEAVDAFAMPGITIAAEYDADRMEGVNNAPELVTAANAAIAALAPDIGVREIAAIIPDFSEDFGSFQRVSPGVMYFLGVSNPEAGTVGMPHAPNYVADDTAILVGARAMLAAMLRLLAQP